MGRAHGKDGAFWVEGRLPDGAAVGGRLLERIGGTDDRPLARAAGVDDREAARTLSGEPITADVAMEPDEWLVEDLVGAEVVGVGTVESVINGPSCDVLVVGKTLIPFVRDAITKIESGRIEVNREFLGL